MILALVVLSAVAVTAASAQAIVHARAVARLIAAHQVDRSSLVAAVIARTPGEYAGLVSGRKDRGTRADPAEPVDPESKIPLGM